LTLKKPILFPADVNRIELPVHKNAVQIAAVLPIRLGSNFFTIVLCENGILALSLSFRFFGWVHETAWNIGYAFPAHVSQPQRNIFFGVL
jgi:hypothetical protein